MAGSAVPPIQTSSGSGVTGAMRAPSDLLAGEEPANGVETRLEALRPPAERHAHGRRTARRRRRSRSA